MQAAALSVSLFLSSPCTTHQLRIGHNPGHCNADQANVDRYRALQHETPGYMEQLGLILAHRLSESSSSCALRKKLHGMDDIVGLRDPAEALVNANSMLRAGF